MSSFLTGALIGSVLSGIAIQNSKIRKLLFSALDFWIFPKDLNDWSIIDEKRIYPKILYITLSSLIFFTHIVTGDSSLLINTLLGIVMGVVLPPVIGLAVMSFYFLTILPFVALIAATISACDKEMKIQSPHTFRKFYGDINSDPRRYVIYSALMIISAGLGTGFLFIKN